MSGRGRVVTPPRLLCIMGSGETAPTMTSVHVELLARVGGAAANAVLIDTPFGFQENADDITARAQAYFAVNVGHPIGVASLRNLDTITPVDRERAFETLRSADYVFAGPGSPSYALRQWSGSPVAQLLAELLARGGCVVASSAAATTIGLRALPVYEVYKVGQPAHWLEGLDLLGAVAGLRCAVVPHYDNAEGGNHDTRYCYMGERRLRLLEAELPEGVGVLGVDEHTAAILNLDTRTMSVRGRGAVIARRHGLEERFTAGDEVDFDRLQQAGDKGVPVAVQVAHASGAQAQAGSASSPVEDEAAELRADFEAAIAARDVDAALVAVLELDDRLAGWVHDNPGTDELGRARSVLRGLLVRLADVARSGARDPREQVAPFVDLALELRGRARAEKRFAESDTVRDRLIELGVEVRDTPGGAEWVLAPGA